VAFKAILSNSKREQQDSKGEDDDADKAEALEAVRRLCRYFDVELNGGLLWLC
jgi:hypothetical protein